MSAASCLKALLAEPGLLVMPCCYDALTAKLIEQADFKLTFMSGFAVSAARLGLPDTGLISYGEMVDQGRSICAATTLPVLGDGDTGYGNAVNTKRTVQGYAQAGFACIMIEDQVSPKRCGHTKGKQVVDRHQACKRLEAAVDARDEGADILIMARTDARGPLGFDEALDRCRDFAALGADIIFIEAPQSEEEMALFCSEIKAPCMANMIQNGQSPLLPPPRLEELGFKIVAYPLTLLSSAVEAMEKSLTALQQGRYPEHISFSHLKEVIGFPEYYQEDDRYS